MKELNCRDIGFDCQGVVRAESEEEVLRQAAQHATTVHLLTELDEATVSQIRSKIRTI